MPSKFVAIIGLGKSGASAVRFFTEQNYKIYLFDDNPSSLEAYKANPNCIIQNPENWDFSKIESVIFSPGIPHLLPKPHKIAELARQNNVEIICDIEVLWRYKPENSKIIAITGTNGKSTTTALIHHILKQNNLPAEIGGNFGIPALDLDLKTDGKIFVIETSSFQLDLLNDAIFDVAVFLNLTPDHLERYQTMQNYLLSKQRVFKGQGADCTSIICIDDEYTKQAGKWCDDNLTSKKFYYSVKDETLKNEQFQYLQGEHNRQNILAAYYATKQFGLSDEQIISAIKTFKGLKHRANIIFENEFIRFVNDSKATNADATEPALKTFENIFWLAGGVAKSGGIESLTKYFPKIKKAYFYGQDGKSFAETFSKAGYQNFVYLEKFEQAFKASSQDAINSGKQNNFQACVLLSPCCASFDEFKNFEHRGEVFEEMTRKYTNQPV